MGSTALADESVEDLLDDALDDFRQASSPQVTKGPELPAPSACVATRVEHFPTHATGPLQPAPPIRDCLGRHDDAMNSHGMVQEFAFDPLARNRERFAGVHAMHQVQSSGGIPRQSKELLNLLAETMELATSSSTLPHTGTSQADSPSIAVSDDGLPHCVHELLQHFVSKEVLYQPMKDINANYPNWLEANKDSLTPEEYHCYQQQKDLIQRICYVYETNISDAPKLVDLLHQVQQLGQPPQDLVPTVHHGDLILSNSRVEGAHMHQDPNDCRVQ